MFEYKPDRSNETLSNNELGTVTSDFEAFQPNPKYGWEKGKRFAPASKDEWKLIVPKTGPPIGKLPQIIENMVKMTWKFAEPSANAQRGNVVMGMRGAPAPAAVRNDVYHPQVRPVKAAIPVATPNSASIAADWQVFDEIERTNAVTFRGDSRTPHEVINVYGGFTPPNTRTDRAYLEGQIYEKFADYLERRYQRPLSKDAFLKAVDSAAPTDAEKKLLIDYAMWRRITKREEAHLGRMVEQECLKGYISTSRAIDTAIQFGTRYNAQDGWVYLTIVHSGFIVPFSNRANWGQGEAEVAQWGPIPSSRIVGFARFSAAGRLNSAIYIRRSFRKAEPKAFEYMFNIFSGKTPRSA